jgi:hypothetical protein
MPDDKTTDKFAHALVQLQRDGWLRDGEEDQEKTPIEKVRDVRRIQGSDGNWNYSAYMRGMYNGLELALSILEGERDPEYRDAPDGGYLCDRPKPDLSGLDVGFSSAPPEEMADLERRFKEALADPKRRTVVLSKPLHAPNPGDVITVGGAECVVNQWLHTSDGLRITATRLHAVTAQPAGSAVTIDVTGIAQTITGQEFG